MKIKFIIMGLLASLINSCSTPRYLPTSDLLDVNQYGSYITIYPIKGEDFNGELLSIDSNKLIVLTLKKDESKIAQFIPLNKVSQFKLLYAKPKNYGWSIPVYSLATFSHGLWLIFTAPVNLIVTISVSNSKVFKYSDKDMTFEKLKMFARYPQGIPGNIDINTIK